MEETKTETIEFSVSKRPRRLILEIQDGLRAIRVPLDEKPMRIGSSSLADITLNDPTVSHFHCEVVLREAQACVKDLSSKNGTFVGGTRVESVRANAGATIVVGASTLHVTEEDEDLPPVKPISMSGIYGCSQAMCLVMHRVKKLSSLASPVLILGETGTGKELVARALHFEGVRKNHRFIPVNVATLPRDLAESELFGHEKGAFTGAVSRREGVFSQAAGGTLFLDEIGELSQEIQPKLLRALDGYEVRKVGSYGGGESYDARVVAATHVPLLSKVESGEFRRDLYHRLEVFTIYLPALRDRPSDIPIIARSLMGTLSREIGEKKMTSDALARLVTYSWPGNIRELRNVLIRAAEFVGDEKAIDVNHIDRVLSPSYGRVAAKSKTYGFRAEKSNESGLREGHSKTNLTPEMALKLFQRYQGNLSAAARAASCPRTSFRKLLLQAGK